VTSINDSAKSFYEGSIAGSLIPEMDYFTAVSLGRVPNVRRVAALGNNPSIDTASAEDVWTGGGFYPYMTSAGFLEVVSSSASDAPAGTGAGSLLVNGLDGNYVEQSETVSLNGLTAVALTKTYLRINSAFIASAGSNRTNVGDISIRSSGGGTVRSIVPAGYGTTRQSIYTVPAGHTLSEISFLSSINRTGGGVVRYATVATYSGNPLGFYRLPLEFSISSNTPYRHDGNPGIIFPEKTDFAIRCTNVTVNATDITAAWLGILRKNV
jgi:hypothetical protein